MKEFTCIHQDMVIDEGSWLTISACRNLNCPKCHAPVSELICTNCECREEPPSISATTFQSLAEVIDTSGLEARVKAERERILENYCLKCSHCDDETKICGACDCTGLAPIDEYIRYTRFHCPLELW